MKLGILGLVSAGAAIFAAAAPAQAAITVGDKLDLEYLFPVQSTVNEDTGIFTYTGAGQTVTTQSGVTFVIVSDYSVTFFENPDYYGYNESTVPFSGPVLFDLTNQSAFVGWSVIYNSVGAITTILTGGEIGINWEGLPVQGDVAIGTLAIPAALPEPSVWAMMVAGFAMVGFAVRRQSVRVTYA